VRKIAPGEIIRIIVNSQDHERDARRILTRVGVDTSRVQFFRFPTNRGWTRDFGPMFVRRASPPPEIAIVQFRFNGWARYPNWKKDALIPARAARALGLRLLRISTESGKEFVLEGGAIDVNGRGTLLTTQECLLDQQTQVRNPGVSRDEIERVLCSSLGAKNILWLNRGIAGDDTHGHIDDVCRFVGPRTVVLCREDNLEDENHRVLEENRELLEGASLEDGSRVDIIRIPMPSPLFLDGQRLPASYANFYISNTAVLVPTFNDPHDRLALGILSEAFTGRPVVGIHAVDLVWGLGTLHCLTHEQPTLNSDI
jgi:agmatine deiminase